MLGLPISIRLPRPRVGGRAWVRWVVTDGEQIGYVLGSDFTGNGETLELVCRDDPSDTFALAKNESRSQG